MRDRWTELLYRYRTLHSFARDRAIKMTSDNRRVTAVCAVSRWIQRQKLSCDLCYFQCTLEAFEFERYRTKRTARTRLCPRRFCFF